MSPVAITLFDAIEEKLRDAADKITEAYEPENGCDPGQLLEGLYTLRCAALSLRELRGVIRDETPPEPSNLRGMVAATQGRPVEQ